MLITKQNHFQIGIKSDIQNSQTTFKPNLTCIFLFATVTRFITFWVEVPCTNLILNTRIYAWSTIWNFFLTSHGLNSLRKQVSKFKGGFTTNTLVTLLFNHCDLMIFFSLFSVGDTWKGHAKEGLQKDFHGKRWSLKTSFFNNW